VSIGFTARAFARANATTPGRPVPAAGPCVCRTVHI